MATEVVLWRLLQTFVTFRAVVWRSPFGIREMRVRCGANSYCGMECGLKGKLIVMKKI